MQHRLQILLSNSTCATTARHVLHQGRRAGGVRGRRRAVRSGGRYGRVRFYDLGIRVEGFSFEGLGFRMEFAAVAVLFAAADDMVGIVRVDVLGIRVECLVFMVYV